MKAINDSLAKDSQTRRLVAAEDTASSPVKLVGEMSTGVSGSPIYPPPVI